jgi:hypothetical protein
VTNCIIIGTGSNCKHDKVFVFTDEKATVPTGHGFTKVGGSAEFDLVGDVGVGILPDDDSVGEAVRNLRGGDR